MDDEAVGGVRRRVKQPAQSMASITKQVPPAGTTTHTDPLVKHGRRQGSCGLHARLGENSRAVSEAEHPIHRRNNRNEKMGRPMTNYQSGGLGSKWYRSILLGSRTILRILADLGYCRQG